MDYGSSQHRKKVWSQTSGGTSTKGESGTATRSLGTSQIGDKEESLQVIVRVRPLMQREATNGIFVSTADVGPDQKSINLYEYFNLELVPPEKIEEYIENPESYQTHTFTFDRVYDENATQAEIYESTAQSAVFSALEVDDGHIRVTMQLCLHTARQEQERLIQWRVLSTMEKTLREE
jgi:hypothetical protein